MGDSSGPIGVIVCKQSMHRDTSNRGYIAMLSVNKNWRKRGIGASPFITSFHKLTADREGPLQFLDFILQFVWRILSAT